MVYRKLFSWYFCAKGMVRDVILSLFPWLVVLSSLDWWIVQWAQPSTSQRHMVRLSWVLRVSRARDPQCTACQVCFLEQNALGTKRTSRPEVALLNRHRRPEMLRTSSTQQMKIPLSLTRKLFPNDCFLPESVVVLPRTLILFVRS